ncbi:MAG: N-acetylmuramate alpha-1-phosphate uridylyltransferase MurU [Halieaceae bacterium]
MKAMILAAGRGERMRPLTDTVPKPLLPLAGKPLIQHHVEALVAAGFTELVINVSWLGAQIESFFQQHDFGCQIHWSREAEPLETAGGIIQALPLLGSEPFALVNADTWTDYPRRQLRAVGNCPQDGAHLVLVDNPPQHPAGDFRLGLEGLVLTRSDDAESTLTYAGLGIYSPGIFAGSQPGRQPLLPFLQAAIGESRLRGEHYRGSWHDVGSPQRLAALDASLGIH